MTNRKLELAYALSIGTKIDDLEPLYVQIFSEFCASSHVWEATTAKRLKADPHCQRENCCALKVLFNDVYRLRKYYGANLVSCVLYTKAIARLPLRELGFLVCIAKLRISRTYCCLLLSLCWCATYVVCEAACCLCTVINYFFIEMEMIDLINVIITRRW